MGAVKDLVIQKMNEVLICKPGIDCACKVGTQCKYFEFEGALKPECNDPYINTEEEQLNIETKKFNDLITKTGFENFRVIRQGRKLDNMRRNSKC